MEKALLQTPLGNLLIEGDENGLTSLSIISDEIKITHTNQKTLEDAIIQLQEYFEGKRKQFTIRLNPQGTNFQKKSMAETS